MTIPDLTGKVILVTGAGDGIGYSASSVLAGAGANVIAAEKPGGVGQLSAAEKLRDRIDVLPCDVRRDRDVESVLEFVRRKFGRLDVLINGAGVIAPIARIGDAGADEWSECLSTNAGGAFRCTSKSLPLLLASRGLVLNLSSGAAYRPLEGWSAYCASKAALVMLTRATAHEYAAQGLRVFALGIAPTDTKMQEKIRASELNPVSRIPREELWKPEAIAAILAWLCGPEAAFLKEIELDVRDALFTYLLAAPGQTR
jgi:NAD(P)-dependent dehydrogenase (short-subunit alcohol dehydrogenase family)